MGWKPTSDDAKMLGWSALAAPVSVILHELGHYAVAVADGIPVQFNPASVTSLSGTEDMVPSIPGLGQAMGPIVTLVLTFGAVLWLNRRGFSMPVFALAVWAPARMLVIFAFLLATGIRAASGQAQQTPNFDEYNALTTLGLPQVPILLVIAILLPIGWWLAIRAIPRGERIRRLISTIVGGAVGLAVWVQWLGPLLLS